MIGEANALTVVHGSCEVANPIACCSGVTASDGAETATVGTTFGCNGVVSFAGAASLAACVVALAAAFGASLAATLCDRLQCRDRDAVRRAGPSLVGCSLSGRSDACAGTVGSSDEAAACG